MLLVYMMGKLRHEEQKFVVTEWRNQVFIVYFVHEPWKIKLLALCIDTI